VSGAVPCAGYCGGGFPASCRRGSAQPGLVAEPPPLASSGACRRAAASRAYRRRSHGGRPCSVTELGLLARRPFDHPKPLVTGRPRLAHSTAAVGGVRPNGRAAKTSAGVSARGCICRYAQIFRKSGSSGKHSASVCEGSPVIRDTAGSVASVMQA